MFKIDKEVLKEELLSSLAILIIASVAAAVLTFFMLNIFIGTVNSGSMYPTMKTGDVSVLRRLNGEPERFDIVTARVEGADYVVEKRIIGLPGELIEVKDGVVYINREELEDEYAYLSNTIPSKIISPRDMPERYIHEDEYFLMGDNRDYSTDSREMGTFNIEGIRYRLINLIPISKIKKNNEFY